MMAPREFREPAGRQTQFGVFARRPEEAAAVDTARVRVLPPPHAHRFEGSCRPVGCGLWQARRGDQARRGHVEANGGSRRFGQEVEKQADTLEALPEQGLQAEVQIRAEREAEGEASQGVGKLA